MVNCCECFIEEDGSDLSLFSEDKGHIQFDMYIYQFLTLWFRVQTLEPD